TVVHLTMGEEAKCPQGVFFCSVSFLVICTHIFTLGYRLSACTSFFEWIDALLIMLIFVLLAGIIGWSEDNPLPIIIASIYLVILYFFCFFTAAFFVVIFFGSFFRENASAAASYRAFSSILFYLRDSYSSPKEAQCVYMLTSSIFVLFSLCLKYAVDDAMSKIRMDNEMNLPRFVRSNDRQIVMDPALLASYQRGLPTSRAVPTEPPPPYQ
ncbi:hypothetical protein PMAYCL1PPCAC_12107, partial [Pristionchus mayeri]